MTDPVSDDADWVLAVPTRRVDSDGTLIVVAQATDQTVDQQGTLTVTLTAQRELVVFADGIDLADFRAWST